MREAPSLIERVAEWRAGVASIDPRHFRVPGVLASWAYQGEPPWIAVHAAMGAFLDEWGQTAAALGWSAESLFGVHVRAGAVRADSTGALVTLYPKRVLELDARTIVLGRGTTRSTFRGLTNPAEAVPVWTFGRAAPQVAMR